MGDRATAPSNPDPLANGPLEDSAIREELECVLSSPAFSSAPQLCRFLRFIVQETIRRIFRYDQPVKLLLEGLRKVGLEPVG